MSQWLTAGVLTLTWGLTLSVPVTARTLSARTLASFAFYGDLADFEIPSGVYLCSRSRTLGQRRQMAQRILEAGIQAEVISAADATDSYRFALEDELKDGVCHFGSDDGFKFGF